MKDRFGKPIRIAWALHELLWLEAAMTLERAEHDQAFHDIAAMTGRTHAAVQTKAYAHWIDVLNARVALRQASRRRYEYRPELEPSCIAPPTKSRLMGAR